MALQCNTNATVVQHNCNVEKDKEKDKEKELEKKDRFRERFSSRRKEKKHSYQNKTFLDISETYDDNIIIKL